MASQPPPPLPSAEDIRAIRAVKDEELPWLPPAPETDEGNRFINKAKENPFVPLGALATLGALTFGLVQFKRGNMAKSQLAMRMRVLAQGGTVVALLLGVLFTASGTNSRKSQTKM